MPSTNSVVNGFFSSHFNSQFSDRDSSHIPPKSPAMITTSSFVITFCCGKFLLCFWIWLRHLFFLIKNNQYMHLLGRIYIRQLLILKSNCCRMNWNTNQESVSFEILLVCSLSEWQVIVFLLVEVCCRCLCLRLTCCLRLRLRLWLIFVFRTK